MPSRSARTTWTGGLQDGTGVVTLVSSGLGTYEVNFPKRAADNADGTTSPVGCLLIGADGVRSSITKQLTKGALKVYDTGARMIHGSSPVARI